MTGIDPDMSDDDKRRLLDILAYEFGLMMWRGTTGSSGSQLVLELLAKLEALGFHVLREAA